MQDAKPFSTSLPTTLKLTLHAGTPLPDAKQYRSVVGSLQYLSFTRPDILCSQQTLSIHASTNHRTLACN